MNHLSNSVCLAQVCILFCIDIQRNLVCWHIVDYIHHFSQSTRRYLKERKTFLISVRVAKFWMNLLIHWFKGSKIPQFCLTDELFKGIINKFMNGLITIINQIKTFVDCRELLKPQKRDREIIQKSLIIPEQVFLSDWSLYPVLHRHSNDPAMLTHESLQPPFLTLHSSMSGKVFSVKFCANILFEKLSQIASWFIKI